MKKSLLSLLLIFNVSVLRGALNNIPRFQLPERFKDYKSHELLPEEQGTINGNPVLAKFYNVDGDGKPDVAEFYPITSYDPQTDQIATTDNPVLYNFDLNGDDQFSYDEILLDENMDGLNGNEIWVDLTKDIPQRPEPNYITVNMP
jgi:hypothetical protein